MRLAGAMVLAMTVFAGCTQRRPAATIVRLRTLDERLLAIQFAYQEPGPGRTRAMLPDAVYYVELRPLMSDADFAAVRATSDGMIMTLRITLTAEAAERIESLTTSYLGRHIAVTFDSHIESAGLIARPLGRVFTLQFRTLDPDGALRLIKQRWPPPTGRIPDTFRFYSQTNGER